MNVNRAQGDYFGAGVLRSMCLSMLIGFLFSTAGRAQTGGPPGIACPGDVTLECVAAVDDGLSGTDCVVAFGSIGTNTDPSNTGSATATDNCTGSPDPDPAITFADVVATGTCPQEMMITRTWTATDNCGSDSCDQTISVVDTTSPQIICSADVQIQCVASTAPSFTGSATATDNCDLDPTIDFTDSETQGTCGSIITRTWTATDNCGNVASCDQFIDRVDVASPPQITCPDDLTVLCTLDPGSGADCITNLIDSALNTDPEQTGFATATDNCDPSPVVTLNDSFADGSCPQETVLTRTWTATDTCSNSSSCDQTITVEDNEVPVITCPLDVTIQTGESMDPSDTGTASATDNCDSSPDVTFTDSGANPIIRTWAATDDCGNSASCDQTITVQGAGAPPVITCPADVTIQSGDPTDPSNTGAATATDDTDPTPTITFTDNVASGTCPEESIITRTFTATDADGNSSPSCDQMITVADTEAPVITCPADQTIESDASSDPGSTGTATAIGGVVAYTDSVSSEVVCPDVFSITRTWEATDQCGNVSSCEQKIAGVDTVAPTLITGIVEGGLPQRSMLRSLAFQFSEDVSASLEAGDLVLENLTIPQTIEPSVMTLTYDSATNTATWTFTFPGPFFESLPDGNYCATLPAAAVEDLGCNNPSSDGQLAFHRVFGDRDGDTDVDFLDSIRFRTCFFGSPNCDFRFDVDSDTDVDFLDLINFGSRFPSQLAPVPCP